MSDKRHNVLIGSGYYDDPGSMEYFQWFFDIWVKNLPKDALLSIVDNSHSKYACLKMESESIWIGNNLGHVGGYLGKHEPRLLGWSMSWIIPATIAYSEGRDFIYKEQDCLAFGDWLDVILGEAEDRKMDVIYGTCDHTIAWCEQSLFYIRNSAIPWFIGKYCSIEAGDGVVLPENKFGKIAARSKGKVGEFKVLRGGRASPRPWEEKTWYAQKFTSDEMNRLAQEGLITLP